MEDGAPQFNTAIKRATVVAKTQGAHAVLILPADLPLIKPSDIKSFLKHGNKPPTIVIAPDRRQDGTNCLLVNPAGFLEYGYGPGSFNRHCERAVANGAKVEIVHSERLGLDLDLPEDLEYLGGLEKLGIK